MNYRDYLQHRLEPLSKETALFPFLDESDPEVWERYKEALLVERFRWLCKFHRVLDSQELYECWINPDPVEEERKAFPEENWATFSDKSIMLGLTMLREEPKYFGYYKALRATLYSRVKLDDQILIIGMTAGGEIEAAANTRGWPVFLSNPEDPKCLQAESRVLSDGLAFDTIGTDDLFERTFPYIVLSPYIVYGDASVRRAYNLLGLYGYLIFPADCVCMYNTCEELEMVLVDCFQQEAAVFYKHPGLPTTL